MELNRKVRLFIIVFIGAVLFSLNTMFVFSTINKEIQNSKRINKENASKISSLDAIEKEKAQLAKREQDFRVQMYNLNLRLPNTLVPENFVINVRNAALLNNLTISDISFTKPEILKLNNISPVYNASQDIINKANQEITKLFTDNKATAEDIKTLQFDNSIPDETPIKVTVGFNYKGTYKDFSNFINMIEERIDNKVAISKISVTGADGSSTSGNVNLTFYGFVDRKIPIYDLWNRQFEHGNSDFFTQTNINYDDINISDFDIVLYPVNWDYQSVTIGKHTDFGSKIYGKNPGNENVDLYLTKINGKYYCKYRTQNISYPMNFNYVEFTPVVKGNDIIVKIYSRLRIDDADQSGIKLTIHNPTDRSIKVLTYNDDSARPRVDYTIVNR